MAIIFDKGYPATTISEDADDNLIYTLSEYNAAPTSREDPLKNMNFVIGFVPFDNTGYPNIADTYWYGFAKCSAPSLTLDEQEYRESGDDNYGHKSPGKGTFDNITLSKGLGKTKFMYSWSMQVPQINAPDETIPTVGITKTSNFYEYRVHHARLVIRNAVFQPAAAYKIYTPWIQKYTPFNDLDSMGTDVLIEEVILAYDGFRRFAINSSDPTNPTVEWSIEYASSGDVWI